MNISLTSAYTSIKMMLNKNNGGNILKNIIMVLVALFILTGCSTKAEQDFEGFASDFYTQMFSDGEQSETVSDMYEKLESNYKGHSDSELYTALNGMYKALGSNESATVYQLEIMALINE